MEIKTVKINELKPHPKNPRVHPDSAIDKLVRSIKEYGWTNPILVSADGYILAGHARLKAAEKAGIEEVPVIYLPLEGVKAEAYLIADNRLQDETDWDLPKLKDLLQELDTGEFDLELTGFDMDEIEELIAQLHVPEDIIEDEVPEPPDEPITKPGDIWQLGRHRLLCGDATVAADVERLMDGKKADMVFTDPPYNVAYGDSSNPRYTAHVSGKHRLIENDKQTTDQWVEFNKALASIFKIVCKGDIYVWGAPGPDGMRQRLTFIDSGIHWSATIIWKKDRLVLAAGKYQRMYEPCFYGWVKKSSFVADRKQVEVWEVKRPTSSELHPTMKPIELCGHGIKNSSKSGHIVLDLFGGSGSTLIACEQLNRACYMMEIDPVYVDVIKNRWEHLTGLKAEKTDQGQTA